MCRCLSRALFRVYLKLTIWMISDMGIVITRLLHVNLGSTDL